MKISLVAVLMLALLSGCGSTPPVASALGEEVLTTSPAGSIRFGPHFFEFTKFVFEEGDAYSGPDSLLLVAKLGGTENYLLVPLVAGAPTRDVQLVYKKSILPVLDLSFESFANESVQLTGRLETGVPVFATLNASAGSSVFRIEGQRAYLNGELGSGTYRQIEYLIHAHPEVNTLVFENVPGSLNDDINVFTGRLIRDAGYATLVPANGMIASGGVALFAAGVQRTIEEGARIGVHAWSIPGKDINPTTLPRDHHAHRAQRRYFAEMLAHGEEFYFFTLQAAPFTEVHWMTPAEVKRFGLETAASASSNVRPNLNASANSSASPNSNFRN